MKIWKKGGGSREKGGGGNEIHAPCACVLSPWSSLRGIPDKNDCCAFSRGSRGEVMTFFEKNKVLGVEPNRVLNILEGI